MAFHRITVFFLLFQFTSWPVGVCNLSWFLLALPRHFLKYFCSLATTRYSGSFYFSLPQDRDLLLSNKPGFLLVKNHAKNKSWGARDPYQMKAKAVGRVISLQNYFNDKAIKEIFFFFLENGHDLYYWFKLPQALLSLFWFCFHLISLLFWATSFLLFHISYLLTNFNIYGAIHCSNKHCV